MWANHRWAPEVASSMATSHCPDKPMANGSFFEPLVLFRGDFSKQSRFRSHRPVLFRRRELEGCDVRQRILADDALNSAVKHGGVSEGLFELFFAARPVFLQRALFRLKIFA